jgi:hypothetical protein
MAIRTSFFSIVTRRCESGLISIRPAVNWSVLPVVNL